MKKLLFFFTFCLIASCNNTADQKTSKSLSSDTATPAGYLATADGKFNASDGDPANLEVWDTYIEAHNNRELDVIREMNADSTKQFGAFKIYDAVGGVVDSPDNHIERLSGWFDAENPKWNTYFSYTMKVDGQVGEWVISGHTLTTNVDGEEKTTYDLADVYIEDGKIGAFWIYSRAAVPSAQ